MPGAAPVSPFGYCSPLPFPFLSVDFPPPPGFVFFFCTLLALFHVLWDSFFVYSFPRSRFCKPPHHTTHAPAYAQGSSFFLFFLTDAHSHPPPDFSPVGAASYFPVAPRLSTPPWVTPLLPIWSFASFPPLIVSLGFNVLNGFYFSAFLELPSFLPPPGARGCFKMPDYVGCDGRFSSISPTFPWF